jgi:hypothetical protein
MPPAAVPPILDPGLWESYPVFRESFLLYISEPQFNAALRTAADHFFSMLLECYGKWPAWPESSTRMELRAAVADMRHLQGFLASIGQERRVASLSSGDHKLSKHAAELARTLNKLAGGIEHQLAKAAKEAASWRVRDAAVLDAERHHHHPRLPASSGEVGSCRRSPGLHRRGLVHKPAKALAAELAVLQCYWQETDPEKVVAGAPDQKKAQALLQHFDKLTRGVNG